ncbi:TPA: hypothetical protein R4X16_004412 [Klebsiella variicola subsp. variicola]|uniref:hypothetical protein n=1 Tax=Klebsiella TaxID=570 RepID=UPI001660A05A|nr:hypothetical protein [Klebsiella variicola]MBD0721905.1 hypothetical protein [Klebsiella variicola]MBY5172761.1 hypothetical protein [Klebsiella variicola]HED1713392.1 hypothetical protein [Klebsiella variicola subsp. variicola]
MGTARQLIQLQRSGLTEPQVEAIVNFVESNQEPLATKTDLADVRTVLKADIAEVKAELKADIAEVKAELKTDIAEIRVDLARLEQRLTLRMGTFAVFIVAFISALKLFG